ncbi:unnamed protein product [Rhodiola kirilowii]
MGAEAQIPVFDFSLENIMLGPKVREACEVHGCFLLRCNDSEIRRLAEEMFEGMKGLFDLPDDIKRRYTSSRPFTSYMGKDMYEGFGIEDVHLVESSQAFTGVFWPQGNPEFSCALNGMSLKLLQMILAMLKVIFESYGVGSYYESFAENNIAVIYRVMKYHAPPSGVGIGAKAHTDKNALTILCQNDVQGLEIKSKDGVWTQVAVPQGCFIVLVGDTLKAWSNGRLHSVRHRVTMSGSNDRYSCGVFAMVKEGVLVEAPKELVDNEHPIRYKPFFYTDFMSYLVESESISMDDALEVFAGI